MARKTIFCTQALWWVDGRLEPGSPHQHLSATSALAAGEFLAQSAAGVFVFSQEIDPAADYWGEATVLAVHGAASGDDRRVA